MGARDNPAVGRRHGSVGTPNAHVPVPTDVTTVVLDLHAESRFGAPGGSKQGPLRGGVLLVPALMPWPNARPRTRYTVDLELWQLTRRDW